MKASLVLLTVIAAGFLAGCESDIAPGSEVPGKFERGIRGKGTLYERDRSSSPGDRAYDPIAGEDAHAGQ